MTCTPETSEPQKHLATDESVAGKVERTLRVGLVHRKWPLIMTVAVLATGMGFMFGWAPIVRHHSGWETGGDLWGIWRAAHYIGWGFLGGVYDPSTGVNSLPGLEVLLAPVAMVSSHLGLIESFPPYTLAHPTAALLLEPIELLLASTVLLGVDALAEQLRVGKVRRISLCIVTAVIAWPTVAIWGHAEDCLALTFAIYALIAALNGKWKACGWLFGFALVTQPLVVMILPLVVAISPTGQRVILALRAFALSAVLAGVAFASDAADTFRSLVQQPTPPSINHSTPWVSLAPRVPDVLSGASNNAALTYRAGKFVQDNVHAKAREVILVSGGAGRVIEVILAILVGLYVWRRPQPPDRLIWLAAALLGMRCMFEAVMTPYYLAPPLLLALAIASRQGGKRFWAACVIALEITVFAYHHLSPWAWWLPVVVGMAAVLALGYPNKSRTASEPPLASEPEDTAEVPAEELSEREPASTQGDELRPRELIG
ncbi:MAG: hypothetical protein ACLPR9_00435 [Acidimicrobiales bacterium]